MLLCQGEGLMEIQEQCKISEEFSDSMFKPTPDGNYIFTLVDEENYLNMTIFKILRIKFDGSWIKFSKQKRRSFSKRHFKLKQLKKNILH